MAVDRLRDSLYSLLISSGDRSHTVSTKSSAPLTVGEDCRQIAGVKDIESSVVLDDSRSAAAGGTVPK